MQWFLELSETYRRKMSTPVGESSTAGYCRTDMQGQIRSKTRPSKLFKPLPSNIKRIGDAIRAARQAKHFTPGSLGAKMGIAAALVFAWEDDISQPSPIELECLAHILDARLSYP